MKHDHIATRRSLGATAVGAADQDVVHKSAIKHVTGRAEYTDDLAEPTGTLHAALGLSTVAHGRILSTNLNSVRSALGVVDVLSAADVPGSNDVRF